MAVLDFMYVLMGFSNDYSNLVMNHSRCNISSFSRDGQKILKTIVLGVPPPRPKKDPDDPKIGSKTCTKYHVYKVALQGTGANLSRKKG